MAVLPRLHRRTWARLLVDHRNCDHRRIHIHYSHSRHHLNCRLHGQGLLFYDERERRKAWLNLPKKARVAIRRMHEEWGHLPVQVMTQILK